MKLSVHFSGGLDLCFNKQKNIQVEIEKDEIRLGDFILILRDKYISTKPEFFIQNDELRPGILCLVNDTDWELEGKEDATLKDKDEVGFISTLHGG